MTDNPGEEFVEEDPTSVPLWMSITELAPVRLFREKTPRVEARQHDGSWLSAETIIEWIRELSPGIETSIMPPGSFNNDPDNAYIAIQLQHGLRYVAAGDWIIHNYRRQFEFYKTLEFSNKYEEVLDKGTK